MTGVLTHLFSINKYNKLEKLFFFYYHVYGEIKLCKSEVTIVIQQHVENVRCSLLVYTTAHH